MERQEFIHKAYNQVKELTLDKPEYQKRILAFTTALVEEDVGDRGDITSDSVLRNLNPKTTARLIAKDSGVCAGLDEAVWFYDQNGIEIIDRLRDGDWVENGESILSLHGKCKDLLRTERMGLNLIQRMSGIATLTHKLIQKIDQSKTCIAATRKTPWGSLDKKAVSVGGGMTHRLGLWDFVLIKENHLTVLKQNGFEHRYIEEALKRAVSSQSSEIVEVEVQNQQEALKASLQFQKLSQQKSDLICIILLDNFSPELIRDTLDKIEVKGSGKNLLFEASGNITPGNINEFAAAGADVVSLGYLTHSPDAFDISQLHEYEF